MVFNMISIMVIHLKLFHYHYIYFINQIKRRLFSTFPNVQNFFVSNTNPASKMFTYISAVNMATVRKRSSWRIQRMTGFSSMVTGVF